MIEDTLIQYGVLGAWTITLLYQQYTNQTKVNQLIINNTQALTKVYEVIKSYPLKANTY